jgi:hypothetical protein
MTATGASSDQAARAPGSSIFLQLARSDKDEQGELQGDDKGVAPSVETAREKA